MVQDILTTGSVTGKNLIITIGNLTKDLRDSQITDSKGSQAMNLGDSQTRTAHPTFGKQGMPVIKIPIAVLRKIGIAAMIRAPKRDLKGALRKAIRWTNTLKKTP